MNTMTKQFLENPNYGEAVHLLLQLHDLIAQGKIDSDEADELREAMEKPWSQLDEAETVRLRVLSANLYMLTDNEVFRPVPPEQRTREWLEPQIEAAKNAQDWDKVLTLLRNGPDFMSSGQIAFLRGAAYFHLGHEDIACLFAKYTFQQNRYELNQEATSSQSSVCV